MDRKGWKLTNWMVARRELFTLQKEREEWSNSKELPATLVRDWATTTIMSKRGSFRLSFKSGRILPELNLQLYNTINDQRPQMISRMDLKWSSTVNDPRCRPQMIQKGKSECMASLTHNIWTRKCVFRKCIVSAVYLLHDYVLKSQKDGFNDNLERNLSLIFATYLWGTAIISKLVEGLLKSGTI